MIFLLFLLLLMGAAVYYVNQPKSEAPKATLIPQNNIIQITTQPPVSVISQVTTQPPVTTTQPPVTTTQPPVTTTQPPSNIYLEFNIVDQIDGTSTTITEVDNQVNSQIDDPTSFTELDALVQSQMNDS